MADNEQKTNDQKFGDQQQSQQHPQQQVVIADVGTQLRLEQQAIARAAQEAEEKHLDEETDYPATTNNDGTVWAGGRYKVNGQYVNAEGKPHRSQKDK